MTSGVYRITDTKTGRFYIGSSKHIEHRWKEHFRNLRKNIHDNDKLQGTYNKRPEALTTSIEFLCAEAYLAFFEQIYITGLEPALNKSRLAYRVEMTPEVRGKISAKNKGKTAWNKGVPQPPEKGQRHSQIMTGKPAWNKGISTGPESDETRSKKSIAKKGKPSNTTGKARSQAAKDKHRATLARKRLEREALRVKGTE